MVQERYQWGLVLPYDQTLVEFRSLQPRPWAYRVEIADAGVTDEYA